MKSSCKTLTATCLFSVLLSSGLGGCANTTAPSTTASTPSNGKSIQAIADEAMKSKGKLTKEQINALITANAKCTPKDK